MGDEFDLDAYFARIGYQGDRAPSLETLAGIHLRHAITIPFENLDPFLRRPVHLDVQSLQEKLVRGGRGGYCFEQNLLLSHALNKPRIRGHWPCGPRAVGLAVDDAVRPRSHMLASGPFEWRTLIWRTSALEA